MSQRLLRKNNLVTTLPTIKGAEGDEDEDDDDDDDDPDAGGGGDNGGGGNTDTSEVVSKAEYDKLFERMQAADRAKSEAVNKVKEYEDKDKTELERINGEAEELRSENETLRNELRQVRIENAFFASNKFKWKNPATALKLVDLSEVEIGEDGKVKGMDKALEALSKSDPYLLDTTDGNDDEKNPSGAGGNSRKRDKKVANREQLVKKYPALRR